MSQGNVREAVVTIAKLVDMDEDGVSSVDLEIGDQKFTTREYYLIKNCLTYYRNHPAGLPGHNIMVIVAKLAEALRL